MAALCRTPSRAATQGNYAEPAISDGVYQITNEKELRWLALAVSENNAAHSADRAVLVKDIAPGGAAEPWRPIGNYVTVSDNNPCVGTFDGAGHAITWLYISEETDAVTKETRAGEIINCSVNIGEIYCGSIKLFFCAVLIPLRGKIKR